MVDPLDGMPGKVAIVTGAGRGLGRAEAVELARLGVRVVVNDYGRTLAGEPDENPADDVVAEIVDGGGEAIVDHGDVSSWADAQAMVARAIERWGQLDILVNNAGLLRDRMLFNMSEDEWDGVIRVHLKGHFCMSRWAAAHWRDQSKAANGPVYGRIVNTASEAFLGQSMGQPNYSAAKAGIVALTMVSALSLRRFGVTANAICPRALTRMTESLGGFDAAEDGFDVFAPENVSPLVAYLASPASARVSGQVFVVYGRMITVLSGPQVDQRFDAAEPWTPDVVARTLGPYYDARTPVRDGFIASVQGGS